MRKMYFLITLTACSLVTAIPQAIFPSSDDRIVNIPARRQPAIPLPGILIQEDFRPGVSNQRRPQEDIKPQEVPSQGLFPGERPVTTTSLPTTTTTTTPLPGNRTQNPDSLLPPVIGGPSDTGHDSLPSQRESSCGKFPNPGECQAAFPRYYFNKTTSQCDCYLFGGCDEDTGSYRTLEECHHRCLPEIGHEGPNCKFVFIDNFSPFVPSKTPPTTSTNRNPLTPPPAPRHPADLPASRKPAASGASPSNRRPGRPVVNNLPSLPGSFFSSGLPSLHQPETAVSDNNIPSRQPTPLLIPIGSSPLALVSLPGGIGIDVPPGGLFVEMSSSQSRHPGGSEEYERDIFG